MNIVKVKDLKEVKNNSITMLLNIEKKSWIKLADSAIEIINSIHGLDESRAIDYIMDSHEVSKDDAKSFIEYVISTGVMELQESHLHIELLDKEIENKRYLSHCYLHITNHCNLKCGYCCIDANNNCKQELSLTQIKSIIRRLSTNKVYQLVLSGGEPLIRKDFKDIVNYARRFFKDLGIVTNGTLITEYNAEFITKNIDKIQISLDSAIPAIHNSIRGENAFERTIQGIKLLKSYGHNQIKITPTINRQNIDNIEDIVKIAKDLDVMIGPRFFTAVGRGNEAKDSFAITYKEVRDVYKRIWKKCNELGYDKYSIKNFYDENIYPKYGCGVCDKQICVDVNGDIYPCAYLMDEGVKVGNIFDRVNIYETIESNLIGKKFVEHTVDNIASCKDCDVRYFCGGGCLSVRYQNTGDICGDGMKCKEYKELFRQLVWNTNEGSQEELLCLLNDEEQ